MNDVRVTFFLLFLINIVCGEFLERLEKVRKAEDLPSDVGNLAETIAHYFEIEDGELNAHDALRALLNREQAASDETRAMMVHFVTREYGTTLEGDDLGLLVSWIDTPHIVSITRDIASNRNERRAGWCTEDNGGLLGWLLAAGRAEVCRAMLASGEVMPAAVDLAVRLDDGADEQVLAAYNEIVTRAKAEDALRAAPLPWLSEAQSGMLENKLRRAGFETADMLSTKEAYGVVAGYWDANVRDGIGALEAMSRCESPFDGDTAILFNDILSLASGRCTFALLGTAAVAAGKSANIAMLSAVIEYAGGAKDAHVTIVAELARAGLWKALAFVLSSPELSNLRVDVRINDRGSRIGVVVLEAMLNASDTGTAESDERRALLRKVLTPEWAAVTGVPVIFEAGIQDLCSESTEFERRALVWALAQECFLDRRLLIDGMIAWPDAQARILSHRATVHPAAPDVILRAVERGLAASDRAACWVPAAVAGLCDAETLRIILPMREEIERVCPGVMESEIMKHEESESANLANVWGIVKSDST